MRIIYIFILICFSAYYSQAQKSFKRELRGVWIVTGKNIDYPSAKNLSSEQQKKEFSNLVDMHKSNGMNAIFMQIRPAADAFYQSPYEPWSEWLTGQQGKAPSPYYDPLAFMIEETHKREMEFHAWFNPFRAVFTIKYANVAKNHISNQKPEWCFTYGLHKYFDPGIPEVREYLIKVILDVVKKYDIDGVHFDDYFYPYPEYDENKRMIEIPDDNTFKKFKGEFTNKADWRRNNLDIFIKTLNEKIKQIKAYIKFGVGPSGIWRNKDRDPKGSDTRGFATYDYLYADILKWIQSGWIDYVAPQIYWTIGNRFADFRIVTDWWANNSNGKHVYVGHGYYNAGEQNTTPDWKDPNQLPNQMRLLRNNPNIQGSIFYRSSTFKKNPNGFNDSLKNNFYKDSVYFPAMPWLTSIPIEMTKLNKERMGKEMYIYWDTPEPRSDNTKDTAIFYAVYKFKGRKMGDIKDEKNRLFITRKNYFTINRQRRIILFGKRYTYVVTAFDRHHNEGNPTSIVIWLKD